MSLVEKEAHLTAMQGIPGSKIAFNQNFLLRMPLLVSPGLEMMSGRCKEGRGFKVCDPNDVLFIHHLNKSNKRAPKKKKNHYRFYEKKARKVGKFELCLDTSSLFIHRARARLLLQNCSS